MHPSEAQARDIIFNKENPKYKLYHSRDRATRDYVTRLFQAADGGVTDISSGGALLERLFAEAEKRATK